MLNPHHTFILWGINNATDDIKPYDEVVLVHNNEIRGVGTALMPSSAMINLNEGMAVKVRG
ncbi:PUA domain-containing protein [Acidiplasma cupricumulans]|uniref:PUA domain-containing protein n=1 Tax=Acidiplasma cupricumulans TaxID=312540 RepID=UPI0015857732|nr:PUA domain-containing protein [Acidiplasma cupricumulans]